MTTGVGAVSFFIGQVEEPVLPRNNVSIRDRSGRAAVYPVCLSVAFLVVLMFTGGASRADALTQPVLRILSLGFMALAIWRMKAEDWSRVATPAIFLFVFVVLCVAHLAPLPPAVWSVLPGRGAFSDAVTETGLHLGWRPLSLAPDMTLNALLATLPGFSTLALLAILPRERVPMVPLALLVTIVAGALLGLSQVYGGWPYPYRITNVGTPVGFFANRNHAALLLAMGLPMITYMVLHDARKKGRMDLRFATSGGVAALVIFPLLFINGSRAGLVAAAIGMVGSVLLVARSEVSGASGRRLLVGLGATLAAVIAIAAIFLASSRDIAITRLFAGEAVGEVRLSALPTILNLIGTYFPFGAGIGTFEPVFKVAEPDELISQLYINHAHNDYLELALDAGLPGALLLVVFAGWALHRSRIAWRGVGIYALHGRLGSILLAQIAIASAFDYPIRTPFMLALLCYCVVALVSSAGLAGRAISDKAAIE